MELLLLPSDHRHQAPDAAVQFFLAAIGKVKIGAVHRAQRREVDAIG